MKVYRSNNFFFNWNSEKRGRNNDCKSYNYYLEGPKVILKLYLLSCIHTKLTVSWEDSNVQSLIKENNVTTQVVTVSGFNPESGNVRTTLGYVTDSTEN